MADFEFNIDGSVRRLDLVEELRIESKIVPHRRGKLYGIAADELTQLRAEVERSDAALQRIGIALCGTDEWTDQATMLGSVVAVAEEFRAEVERLETIVETCDIGLFDAFVATKGRAEKAEAEVARLTEVSGAWQRGFAERGVQLERLTAELEALRASVSLLEEQHQLDWTERERQSTQLLHLSDQAEALRTDAKRLDTIERNLWFVEPRYQYDPVQFGVGKADAMKVAKTLRAAIDAAWSAT